MSANTTTTGCMRAALPMIFGFRKYASSAWMPMIQNSIPKPARQLWASAMMTMGTELMMVPKMGMRLKKVAMVASRKANFTPKSTRPTNGRTPFTMQMGTCPLTTPARPRSSRPTSAAAPADHGGGGGGHLRRDQRREVGADPCGIDGDEGRDHQHQEEGEDPLESSGDQRLGERHQLGDVGGGHTREMPGGVVDEPLEVHR